ncbi:MAG: phosphoesterase [Firmicutes bacterium HGW-Firmicutes-1]|nr:MAG: phosphoesterase [Firmicutes bacterium HGW-Firmicutes-1]
MNKKLVTIIVFVTIMIGFLYQQNNAIDISRLEISSEDIPDAFNGYKILQISDLHSKEFGENQKRLVKKILDEDPDVILVTGDAIDSKNYDEDVCIQLFSQVIDLVPIYFVTGNHEAWSNTFDEFEKRLIDVGVIVLRNESKLINIEDSSILIVGVDDPDIQQGSNMKTLLDDMDALFAENYTLLLSHRPELIDIYSESDIDLVFSGHAHGGQVRLPMIGGLIAPDQGWFPKFTSGIYHKNNTTMIVSRGLGNSIIPQRIFNKPELILVTLTK